MPLLRADLQVLRTQNMFVELAAIGFLFGAAFEGARRDFWHLSKNAWIMRTLYPMALTSTQLLDVSTIERRILLGRLGRLASRGWVARRLMRHDGVVEMLCWLTPLGREALRDRLGIRELMALPEPRAQWRTPVPPPGKRPSP